MSAKQVGVKVSVRAMGSKKGVVAIVAPEGAAPERTIESFLVTLLASRDEHWARMTLATLIVIAARNTGSQCSMVHESFPVSVRGLVREAYESSRHTIANSTRDSIVLGARLAFRSAKCTPMVQYVDRRAPKRSRPVVVAEAASSSSSSSSSSGSSSSSDDETEDERESKRECCALVKVCGANDAEAKWMCYECKTKKGYALMCIECIKVHAAWDKTRHHVPVALGP